MDNKLILLKIEERLKRCITESEAPEMMAIALGQLRSWVNPALTRPEVQLFLISVRDLPDECAVQLTKSTISLISDDDGNILAFR